MPPKPKREQEGSWVTVRFDSTDDRAFPEQGQLLRLADVQLDPHEGLWMPAWGAVNATPGYDTGDGDITAMHWWQPRLNQRFLLVERRTSATTCAISWLDLRDGGEPVDLATDRRRLESRHPPARFLDIGRFVVITSPLDGPIRWDGFRVAPFGFAAPAPAPVVRGPDQDFNRFDASGADPSTTLVFRERSLQRGVGEYPADEDAVWRYGYRMTIVDDMGQESPPSAMVFASGTNTADEFGKRMVLVLVDQLPPHIRGVRIWRTLNLAGGNLGPVESATVYLVAQFGTAAGFAWVDHTPDSELIRALDEDNLGTVPQGARAAELWYGRCWMIGSPDAPRRLRYSAPGLPGQWPSINFFDVGSSASGPGMALKATPRGLLVGLTDGLYLVKPQGDSFRLETLVEGVGVISAASFAVLPDLGVFFVSESGPMLLVGSLDDDQPTRLVPLDKRARKLWREAGDLRSAQTVYDPVRREVWVQTQQAGLVYHLDADAWSTRSGWGTGAAQFYGNRLWLGTTGGLGVWVVSAGARTRPDGTDIVGVLETVTLEAHEMWAPGAAELLGVAFGEPTLEIEARSDRATRWTPQSETERAQHHHSHHPDVWGSGLWDDGSEERRWGDYEPTRMRISLGLGNAFAHQFRLSGQVFAWSLLALDTPPGVFKPRPYEEPQ